MEATENPPQPIETLSDKEALTAFLDRIDQIMQLSGLEQHKETQKIGKLGSNITVERTVFSGELLGPDQEIITVKYAPADSEHDLARKFSLSLSSAEKKQTVNLSLGGEIMYDQFEDTDGNQIRKTVSNIFPSLNNGNPGFESNRKATMKGIDQALSVLEQSNPKPKESAQYPDNVKNIADYRK
jgi:hypothetical protein